MSRQRCLVIVEGRWWSLHKVEYPENWLGRPVWSLGWVWDWL